MTGDLFDDECTLTPWVQVIGEDAVILRHFAIAWVDALLEEIHNLQDLSPFRRLQTPGGFWMSVGMSNCGSFGWISDRKGYRYVAIDPVTGNPWPAMPDLFYQVAAEAAEQAGFKGFVPDACLINRYEIGTKMSLHQDKDEQDMSQPIVSVSLGLPAVFMFGGQRRQDPVQRFPLFQGDVVVWGGRSRLNFHGVMPLKADLKEPNTQVGVRYNLTFRKAF